MNNTPDELALQTRSLYIDLLRDTLTMTLWRGDDGNQLGDLCDLPADELRAQGLDWPRLAFTMIGNKRMCNLQYCVEEVLARDIPGDFIETGVWRGGACIFMRGMLKAHGISDRAVWVADSFAGLPPGDPEKYPADAGSTFHLYPQLAISQESVEENFRRFGLLDGQVRMLKGFFRDTLPTAPVEKLAILRLDGDMYESTMDALTNLYDKLSEGGYVIIDDYVIPQCRSAVHDFRTARGINDFIEIIDWAGAYWRKGSGARLSEAAATPDELAAAYEKLLAEYDRASTEAINNRGKLLQLRAQMTANK